MHARRVKTPTLNICGALDRYTLPEGAVQFHNALLENGVKSVLVTYPEEGRGVRKFPAAIDYAARVVAWFQEHMLVTTDNLRSPSIRSQLFHRRGLGDAESQWAWAGCILALLLAGGAWAGDLPHAQPHELGFSAERLTYIDQLYAEKVKNGELAGIVTLIARHGRIVHFSAIGYADVENKRKMQTDSIFRLYSMTKPIAATALMMLYEEGRFQLSDPLSKYIPQFADLRVLRSPDGALDDTVPLERAPTIQDVLRHTAGFSHGLSSDAYDQQYTEANLLGPDVSLAEMVNKLSKIPLRYPPGTKFAYSVGPDIEARLAEVLSGMPFDEFLEERLFKPLGMKDTGFWVSPDNAGRLAGLHSAKDGKLAPMDMQGEPDPHTANHKRKGGSFGLVSTAEDYWRFAQMLLNGGEFEGKRILAPRVVRYMTRDHLQSIEIPNPNGAPSGLGWGLGFSVVKDAVQAASLLSQGTFSHAGAAATYCWIDPKEDMVVVAMTQHFDTPGVEMLWAQIPTLVYSALVD